MPDARIAMPGPQLGYLTSRGRMDNGTRAASAIISSGYDGFFLATPDA
jgi:hypothetical protein